MYEYLIIYSYWKDGRRVKAKDIFIAGSDQEAVDHCREFYKEEFILGYGRIEAVYRDGDTTWEIREGWE